MPEAWEVGSTYPIEVGDGKMGVVSISFHAAREYQMPENAWLGVDISAILRPEQALVLAEKIKHSAENAIECTKKKLRISS